MKCLYILLLFFAAMGLTVLFSGCTGVGTHSVYSGYGYPYYGNSIGYRRVYYDADDTDHRRSVHNRHRQTRPQRVERSQAHRPSSPARNMGRPKSGGRRK